MENLVGKQLGAYKILQRLGRGGMGSVYRAQRSSQPIPEVAIKVLADFESVAEDPGFVARFKHEIGVLARLKHPHIVPLLDYGEAEGYPYMVMPIFSGGTLGDRFKATGALTPDEVIKLATQIGSALDYAHQQGLVHRDVKPANVLIDEMGNYRLADFGIAKSVAATTRYTQTGALLGTPIYMSPEQAQGLPTDHRSDIYAFGSVLYEMATGRAPFVADDPFVLMRLHIEGVLTPPRALNPTIPPHLELAIRRALAKQPADRYQSMGELVAALQAPPPGTTIDGPAPLPAASVKPAKAPARPAATPAVRRNRPWVAIGALLLISVLLFVILLVGTYVLELTQQLNANSTQLAYVTERAALLATQAAGATPTPSLLAPISTLTPTAMLTLLPSPLPTLAQAEVGKLYRDELLLDVVQVGELMTVPTGETRYVSVNHNVALLQGAGNLHVLGNSVWALNAVTDTQMVLNVWRGTDLFMNTGPYAEGSEVQLEGGGFLALRGQGCWAVEYLLATPKVRMSCYTGTCAYRLNLATGFATFKAGLQLVIDDVAAPVPALQRISLNDTNKYYNLLLRTPAGHQDQRTCGVNFSTGIKTATPTATSFPTLTPTLVLTQTLTPTSTLVDETPGDDDPTDTPTPPGVTVAPITDTPTPTLDISVTPSLPPQLTSAPNGLQYIAAARKLN